MRRNKARITVNACLFQTVGKVEPCHRQVFCDFRAFVVKTRKLKEKNSWSLVLYLKMSSRFLKSTIGRPSRTPETDNTSFSIRLVERKKTQGIDSPFLICCATWTRAHKRQFPRIENCNLTIAVNITPRADAGGLVSIQINDIHVILVYVPVTIEISENHGP